MWDSVKFYGCGLHGDSISWEELEKAIGGGITYTDSDILFTLFPKEIDTELVIFSQTSSLRYYPDNKHDNCEYWIKCRNY